MFMSSKIKKNKTLVRLFFAAIESGNFGIFDQIVSHDYNDHGAGQSPGRENLKIYFTRLRSAFPDLKLPMTAIVAEGDYVAVLNAIQGTHKGDFGGIRATGKRVNAMAFQLYRIANGQLAEHWEVADSATIIQQLQPEMP
jgi:steroid delta-isomerase-like uncharacterized protein